MTILEDGHYETSQMEPGGWTDEKILLYRSMTSPGLLQAKNELQIKKHNWRIEPHTPLEIRRPHTAQETFPILLLS